jgi:hypothetical protein
MRRLGWMLAAASLGGCTGEIGGDPPQDTAPSSDELSPQGIRRLTRYEYEATVRDLVGDDTGPGKLLPEDIRAPFDNDATTQQPSKTLVDAIELQATDVAVRLRADAARMRAVVGCDPSGPTDDACFVSFVESFGRRALRRPLDAAELDAYVELARTFAEREQDFFAGAEVVVRSMLQDVEFIYRVEIGSPVDGSPGVFRLSDFEVASRLSYLLWATGPDDALLDRAERGELSDEEGVKAAAVEMLADERAVAQIDRFHALWLGFDQLPHDPTLTQAMRVETGALLRRVIVDERAPWRNIFLASETYVDDALAAHYGLPAPGGAGWVPYGDTGRMGILSQGAFLSAGVYVGDTSPTRRGQSVRLRLFCETVPPPPPDVLADAPPPLGTTQCKEDAYLVHRQGECASCHALMDEVGFGLENYDGAGRYRAHDEGKPECVISGQGEVVGVGEFVGPAGLGRILVDQGIVEACIARQLYQFTVGHPVTDLDQALVDDLAAAFTSIEGGGRFDDLLLLLVSQPGFLYRVEVSQ